MKNQAKTKQYVYVILLFLTSVIWGFAFVAQSKGAESLGTFSFLSFRCWIATLVLFPLFLKRVKKIRINVKEYLAGSLICGSLLFLAASAQQYGVAYTTTGKAGFITAMYVVIVPVILFFKGNRPSRRIVFCLVLSVVGLSLLCINQNDLKSINKGDLFEMLCAVLFSFQIIAVTYFVKRTDPLLLSLGQLFFEGLFSTIFMLIFEKVQPQNLMAAMPAILYAGIMSSGVGFTLQIIAQTKLNPTIASLIMCLESVFSVIGGALILKQYLTIREIIGCSVMFLSIVICQLPDKSKEVKQFINGK